MQSFFVLEREKEMDGYFRITNQKIYPNCL